MSDTVTGQELSGIANTWTDEDWAKFKAAWLRFADEVAALASFINGLNKTFRGLHKELRRYAYCSDCRTAWDWPTSGRWKMGRCSGCGRKTAVWRLVN